MRKEKEMEFEVSPDATRFIKNNYLKKVQVAGVSIAVGVSQGEIEAVLSLFIEWAELNGLIKDGKLSIEEMKEI